MEYGKEFICLESTFVVTSKIQSVTVRNLQKLITLDFMQTTW
jgi:hypothetical protein